MDISNGYYVFVFELFMIYNSSSTLNAIFGIEKERTGILSFFREF